MIERIIRRRYVWHVLYRLFAAERPEPSLEKFAQDISYAWSADDYEQRTLEVLDDRPV